MAVWGFLFDWPTHLEARGRPLASPTESHLDFRNGVDWARKCDLCGLIVTGGYTIRDGCWDADADQRSDVVKRWKSVWEYVELRGMEVVPAIPRWYCDSYWEGRGLADPKAYSAAVRETARRLDEMAMLADGRTCWVDMADVPPGLVGENIDRFWMDVFIEARFAVLEKWWAGVDGDRRIAPFARTVPYSAFSTSILARVEGRGVVRLDDSPPRELPLFTAVMDRLESILYSDPQAILPVTLKFDKWRWAVWQGRTPKPVIQDTPRGRAMWKTFIRRMVREHIPDLRDVSICVNEPFEGEALVTTALDEKGNGDFVRWLARATSPPWEEIASKTCGPFDVCGKAATPR